MKFSSLGVRIERENEGKRRGRRGLLTEGLDPLFNALKRVQSRAAMAAFTGEVEGVVSALELEDSSGSRRQ